MPQDELLSKLKKGEITVNEFLESSNDTSIDKYKLTKEEFLNNSKIPQKTKDHELKHAAVYEDEGLEVEFYYFGEKDREAATTATKESITKWANKKTNETFIELMKKVLQAPDDPGDTDTRLLELLNSKE